MIMVTQEEMVVRLAAVQAEGQVPTLEQVVQAELEPEAK